MPVTPAFRRLRLDDLEFKATYLISKVKISIGLERGAALPEDPRLIPSGTQGLTTIYSSSTRECDTI